MASTQIQTTSLGNTPFQPSGHAITRAGTRIWIIVSGGQSGSDTGVNLYYSDNDGGTWTKPTGGDLDTTSSIVSIEAVLNGATWELHCCWSGFDFAGAQPLKYANILSNVASGTPGTVTVSTVDAGGANASICFATLFLTPTGSNPRVWMVGAKQTAATTVENRAWLGAMGTASPSFSTTNFTNLGSSSATDTTPASNGGQGVYWSVSAANKATIVAKKRGTPGSYDAFTFDPAAATPTPGSATNFAAMDTGTNWSSDEDHGDLQALNAKADYIVFARHNRTAGTVEFYKSVNGTSWSQPTGWTALTMGRMQISSDGTDFWIVHAASFGNVTNTSQVLKYRKITTSSDTMGGVTTFSDTNGNPVSVPRNTGTSNLYCMYRGSTASPYTVRSDFVSIGGGGDTTPPGSASVSATAHTAGARVDLSATMPPDPDVAQYEIRFSTSDYPAANRSDGTVIVSPTGTSPSAVVTFSHTSLTNGTRYYYRVFVKDTAGNWNTGTQATAVAATPVSFTQRYKANGVTTIPDGVTPGGANPIFEFTLAAANFESGKVAHFRLRVGNDNAQPPTLVTVDYVSTPGDGTFKYEDPAASGTFVAVSAGGLDPSFFTRKLRAYTNEVASSRWASLRVEQ